MIKIIHEIQAVRTPTEDELTAKWAKEIFVILCGYAFDPSSTQKIFKSKDGYDISWKVENNLVSGTAEREGETIHFMFRYAEYSAKYRFAVLDSTTDVHKMSREILSRSHVMGIAIINQEYVKFCNHGNIDPHNKGGNIYLKALEHTMNLSLPPDGSTLMTDHQDLRSVIAMAAINLRAQGTVLSASMSHRLNQVAYNKEIPLLEQLIADPAVQLNYKVAMAEQWLRTGEEPTNESPS